MEGKFLLYSIMAPALVFAGLLFFAGSAFAADTLSSTAFIDADEDGTVDHLKWTFDASITACDYEAGDWSIDTAGTIGVTAITGISTDDPEGTGDGACDGSDAVVYIDVTTTANVTGGATAPVVSYSNAGTTGSLADSGAITDKASQTQTDGAAPVVVSEGTTAGSVASTFAIRFSEPMVTTFAEGTEFAFSPDPGSFSTAWSSGNTIVTITPPLLTCGTAYTITTDNAEIDASAGTPTQLVTTGPADGDWSFNTVCGGAGGGGQTYVEPSVDITSVSALNTVVDITWIAEGNGVSYVNLYYVMNGTSTLIVSNISAGVGSYTWRAPDSMLGATVQIKVEATDLAEVLATTTSSSVTLGEPSADAEDQMDEEEQVTPVPGVTPGDVVKSASGDAVYYVTATYGRRVFMNAQSYFTWFDDFSDVRVVSDATLQALPLEGIMLPKAGVVLVKIVSDPRVYALVNGTDMYTPQLRAIDNENIARDLYGASWADYVIDVDTTFFSKFTMGPTIYMASDLTVDVSMMKKRVDLK